MRNTLQYQFEGLISAWKDGMNWEFKRSAIAFGVLWLLSWGACMALPELREYLVGFLLSSLDSLNILDQNGNLSALAVFSSNFQATAFIMLYGLLPFLQLPAMALGLNSVLLGVMAAWMLTSGYSFFAYLAALVPHAVFELPALFLAFAMGLYVCGQLSRRIRGDKSTHSLWNCLVLISRLLLLVEIPLLAAAALMEAHVTPLVASLFF